MLSGTHESVYEYDGQSRRVRITEKENSVQTKQETFIWCGSRICQQRSGSTVVKSYFENGFEENGTGDYFYTRDHLGNVREVVASDGTTVGSRLWYDPWGKVTETGSVLSDFTYTGHHYDRPTGLSLAWYRGYDPNLGRWLSKDPIGLKGGLNLYGYVSNDPINHIDWTGEGVRSCMEATARYLKCKQGGNRSLDNRKKEREECGEDKGHNKAIEQKKNRCEVLREKAFRACKDPATWGPLLLAGGVGAGILILTGGGAAAAAGALLAL